MGSKDNARAMEATPPPSSKHVSTFSSNTSPFLSSPSPSPLRLWRPAAQRNIRNQWPKLLAGKERWLATALEGRSHATSLVNTYLNQKYLPDMDLGVLKDMPGIRQKASQKLIRNQERYCSLLVSSYKEMVVASSQMARAAHSMRCYLKRSASITLIQFCDYPEVENDHGDGGGIPVFSLYSVSYYEKLAQEIVDMFQLELSLKRLLVIELLSLCSREGMAVANEKWSFELYPGEFDDFNVSSLQSEGRWEPPLPRVQDWPASTPSNQASDGSKNSKIMQVYLAAWLANVNINMNRVNEILTIVEEAIQVKLS